MSKTVNPVSTVHVGSTWNMAKIGQVVSEEKLFNNIMILYMYTALGHGRITLQNKILIVT